MFKSLLKKDDTMRKFIDWAGAEMPYKFRLIDVYGHCDKEWVCYVAIGAGSTETDDPRESPLWSAFGYAETKAIALRRAIKNWNNFDKEGTLP